LLDDGIVGMSKQPVKRSLHIPFMSGKKDGPGRLGERCDCPIAFKPRSIPIAVLSPGVSKTKTQKALRSAARGQVRRRPTPGVQASVRIRLH
jgi:hypothetical protein